MTWLDLGWHFDVAIALPLLVVAIIVAVIVGNRAGRS